MQPIHLTLSAEEVKALIQISQNQLFRLRFLDPKMPGYKARPGEVEAVERAVKTLETALKGVKGVIDDGGWTAPIRRDPNHRLR
jgi:DNA-directed RNA polymerase subunit H (RpoH/RPB5)